MARDLRRVCTRARRTLYTFFSTLTTLLFVTFLKASPLSFLKYSVTVLTPWASGPLVLVGGREKLASSSSSSSVSAHLMRFLDIVLSFRCLLLLLERAIKRAAADRVEKAGAALCPNVSCWCSKRAEDGDGLERLLT
jgi:hypothetical protein